MNKKKQSGFTLIELLLAISMLSASLTILFMIMSNFIDRSEVQENQYNLTKLTEIVRQHYDTYAYVVDQTSDSQYIVPSEFVSISNGDFSDDVEFDLISISRSASTPDISFTDGFNQPYKILISNRLEKSYRGINIPYRVIAIVSNNDGDYDSGKPDIETTIDVNTGEITEGENESVAIINTYNDQVRRFIESQEKIENIADAYTQLYWSRFNQSSNGGVRSRDYFAQGSNTNWDSSSGILQSCTPSAYLNGFSSPGTNISNTGLSGELQLSRSSYTDSWGNEFYMMNCGTIPDVRIGDSTVTLSPRNPDAGNSQPYNAIIGMMLGNGQSYIKTITARM